MCVRVCVCADTPQTGGGRGLTNTPRGAPRAQHEFPRKFDAGSAQGEGYYGAVRESCLT